MLRKATNEALIHMTPWKASLLNIAVPLSPKGKQHTGQSHAYLTTGLAFSHSNMNHLEWEAVHTL